MSLKPLQSLFAQKSWADSELYSALAALPNDFPAQSFHTALRTLNHIFVVDNIFKAHLSGEVHGYSASNTDATPTLDELHFGAAETDRWYEGYVKALDPLALDERMAFRFTDGDNGTMTREEMLFHVLSHGSYHRGNVGQIMKNHNIAPPRDLYTKFLHLREPHRRWV